MSHGGKVLLLHTGGTLGMSGRPLAPEDYAERLHDRVPELSEIAEIDTRIVCNLDSSNVGAAQWSQLATLIADRREEVDGVVIIHGTDTMAYTASALAFALRGIDRPVVLTGAQLPLASLRTDARRNLQDALTLATSSLPEVGICFDGLFLRGCRSVKNDARSYRAFASPGLPPLAQMGLAVDMAAHVRQPSEPFTCQPRFDEGIAVVYLHPGMARELLDRVIEDPGVRGVVLAAFGVGNIPTTDPGLVEAVRRAVTLEIDVVVVTQWGGEVDLGAYQTGRVLLDAGAIAGGRMRIEAAVPKLMHAIANIEDTTARRAWLRSNIAGEL